MSKYEVTTFRESNTLAKKFEHSPILREYYRRLFDFRDLVYCDYPQNKEKQEAGIDQIIILDDGQITLDVKLDAYCDPATVLAELEPEYHRAARYETGNLAVEEVAAKATQYSPEHIGWVRKPGYDADYILYCFFDGKAYWLPAKALRSLFLLDEHKAWREQFKLIQGKATQRFVYVNRVKEIYLTSPLNRTIPREALVEKILSMDVDAPYWSLLKDHVSDYYSVCRPSMPASKLLP